ncbi:hypothetical protein GALMADRAFT_223971 [Galerina marginata CBS 339.88]|uniref:Uncharacterized protein n=1 Tax=Galerina marginata (strain CBS 339.88) TaxID=685588 RepID=A0A067TIB2_GALM3|nr:hypothetical protein GALMADRAFT_223971 [Galerina marginata CBS 339.88]
MPRTAQYAYNNYATDDRRQIDPLSKESMEILRPYTIPPFDPNPPSLENYSFNRKPSYSPEEQQADPVFHRVLRPGLEGREPGPDQGSLFYRRLSQDHNPSPPSPPSSTSRSRFLSVSSMNSDSSFYQKGNLHPRGSTPIQEEEEEEEEGRGWKNWSEPKVERVEQVTRQRYQPVTPSSDRRSSARPSTPTPTRQPPGPQTPTRTPRRKAAEAALDPRQLVCKVCNGVYIHQSRAEKHLKKFRDHYF